MLPSRLWSRTALGSPEVIIRSYRPGMANQSLDVTLPWWWPDDDPPQSTMPVPVITLQADSVAAWARVVMGAGGVETPGVFATPPAGKTAATSRGSLPDAGERVQRFRVTVSPIAYRLAVYLSAALRGKWELALARVVQEAMLPDSGQVHLAEVLVGGLVRQADPRIAGGEPLYEFVGGVASVLQRSLTGTEALQVLQALGGYVERETGRSPGIAAMLLGETPPADTSDQFGDVRAGAADLIRSMGLARAEGVPAPATEATSPATAIDWVQAAVTWGPFIQAVEAQYASDPGQVNPATINMPAGYTLVRTIQMTDFFGPVPSRVFCGFVAVGGDPKTAVVALRGTATATEWWADFHWDLVPFTQVPGGGRVAQGFVDIYSTLGTMTPGQQQSTPTANFAADVARAAADALGTDLDPDLPIVVCGHSLGGALATLLVLELTANTPLWPQVWIFASPKVGDAVFAARYAGVATVSWRIYNQADIIPYLPLDVFDNYQPVTTGYAINSQGKAEWTLGRAHSLNTYLHVLSPATVPLDPA
jgi:pimeloyl-ACP methyl ester carboxylesterase